MRNSVLLRCLLFIDDVGQSVPFRTQREQLHWLPQHCVHKYSIFVKECWRGEAVLNGVEILNADLSVVAKGRATEPASFAFFVEDEPKVLWQYGRG